MENEETDHVLAERVLAEIENGFGQSTDVTQELAERLRCSSLALDASIVYARTEGERARSAEAREERAQLYLRKSHDLRREILAMLEARGYHPRAYDEYTLPGTTKTVIQGSKYDPGEFHILQVVKHLFGLLDATQATAGAEKKDQKKTKST